jgi:hypothetical protein
LNHASNEGVTLSTEQQTVFNWLNGELELPVYAEAYKGALELLEKKSPGYITFVSHAGRDLMNGLARLGTGREQVQYANRLDGLQDDWEDEWGTAGVDIIDNPENGHVIPYEVCEQIQDLIDEHRAGRLRPSEAAILFFSNFLDYAYAEEIPRNLLTEWQNTREWFRGHAHLRDSAFEMEASTEVERHFQTLDDLLYNAASSELERIRSINEILEETNE